MSGIILFADTHFGRITHDGPGFGVASWRQFEAVSVAAQIALAARERGALLVCAGDLYNGNRPQPWAYDAADALGEFEGIPGNHDSGGVGSVSPLDVTRTGDFWREPGIRELGGIDVALLPWFTPAWAAARFPDCYVAERGRMMLDATERIVAALASRKRAGVPLILVTHFTISGAKYDSDDQPNVGESGDFVLPRAILDRPEFDAVFSGHIHMPQSFNGEHTTFEYLGGATRTGFTKHHQNTHALYLTVFEGHVQSEVIPIKAIEFVSVDLNRVGEYPDDFTNKVVRITGEAPAGEQTAARIAYLTAAAYEAGALRVAKPAVKFTRHEARAVRAIPTDTKPADALRTFAEMVGGQYTEHLDELLLEQAALEKGALL